MELKLDIKAICAECKKGKLSVDICRMKDQSFRNSIEVEFSVCGVCGKGYCSLRNDPVARECEHCKHKIYSNVQEDGSLEHLVVWQKQKRTNTNHIK